MCNLWQRPWQRHAYNSLARHCMPSGRNNRSRGRCKARRGRPVIIIYYAHLALMAGILLNDWWGEGITDRSCKMDVFLKITFHHHLASMTCSMIILPGLLEVASRCLFLILKSTNGERLFTIVMTRIIVSTASVSRFCFVRLWAGRCYGSTFN